MNWTVILHINHWHRELWWWIELLFYTSITDIENFDDELNCYSTHQSLSSRTLVMNWTVILHINHCHRELKWRIELLFYTSIMLEPCWITTIEPTYRMLDRGRIRYSHEALDGCRLRRPLVVLDRDRTRIQARTQNSGSPYSTRAGKINSHQNLGQISDSSDSQRAGQTSRFPILAHRFTKQLIFNEHLDTLRQTQKNLNSKLTISHPIVPN